MRLVGRTGPATDIEAVLPELRKHRAVRVAHSAANHRAPMQAAVEAGVDLIEADVWPRWNRVVSRHERGVFALPLVFDKWYARPEIMPITLQEIISTVGDRAGLYLDLKSDNQRYLDHIVEIVGSAGMTERTAITSPHWQALSYIEAQAPAVSSYYTVIARRNLWPFWDHLDEHPEVNGTAMRHGLLNPDLIGALHERGLKILAWTVDSPARALQLLRWGVDGIISNRLDLLQAIPAAGPEEA